MGGNKGKNTFHVLEEVSKKHKGVPYVKKIGLEALIEGGYHACNLIYDKDIFNVVSSETATDIYNITSSLRYQKKDITIYSKWLQKNQGFCDKEILGMYLSSVVNRKMKDDSIITLHLDGLSPHYIGHKLNIGKLHIYGDVGDYLGENMMGGELTLWGNAGKYSGSRAKGGRIIVHENVDMYCGHYMQGGELIIHGDADGGAGYEFKSGVLDIRGKCNGLHVTANSGSVKLVNKKYP